LFLDGGIELADKVFSETVFGDDPELFNIWSNPQNHPLIIDEPDGDRHWIKQSHVLQVSLGGVFVAYLTKERQEKHVT